MAAVPNAAVNIYAPVCVDMFSVLSSMHLGVELLGRVPVFEDPRLVSTAAAPCYIPPAVREVPASPHPRQHLLPSGLYPRRLGVTFSGGLAGIPWRQSCVLKEGWGASPPRAMTSVGLALPGQPQVGLEIQ